MMAERNTSTSEHSLIKIDLEIKDSDKDTVPKDAAPKDAAPKDAAPKAETMDREEATVSKKCMKCSATATSICGICIGCWRFCLNSCEVCMECNIRFCICAKACLERIDCDDTR